jgi:hypothetical protein
MVSVASVVKTRRMLTIGIAALTGLFAYQIQEFTFLAQNDLITVRAEPLKPFLGVPLALYSHREKLCFSTELGLRGCSEHFVGAVTLVQFVAHNSKGKRVMTGEIYERVVLIDKSPGAPNRPTFTKSVRFLNGIASDIQLFGYDEDDIAPTERAQSREDARRDWTYFRQELYWNRQRQPFAVIDWLHTIDSIRLVCVAGEILRGLASVPRCGDRAHPSSRDGK